MFLLFIWFVLFFFSSRRRHTRCALVTGVQTCALPISRAQKVNYVVHAGLDPAYVEAELGIDVAAERAGLIKTIDRLSKFAHVNEDSFGSEQEEVERHVYAEIGRA